MMRTRWRRAGDRLARLEERAGLATAAPPALYPENASTEAVRVWGEAMEPAVAAVLGLPLGWYGGVSDVTHRLMMEHTRFNHGAVSRAIVRAGSAWHQLSPEEQGIAIRAQDDEDHNRDLTYMLLLLADAGGEVAPCELTEAVARRSPGIHVAMPECWLLEQLADKHGCAERTGEYRDSYPRFYRMGTVYRMTDKGERIVNEIINEG